MRTYEELNCINCNMLFRIKPSLKNVRKFCSKKCCIEFQIGKPLSIERKLNIGKSMCGKIHSKETRKKIKNSLLGKKHTMTRRINISNSLKGKNNPNWTGGSKLQMEIRNLYFYSYWRLHIFKRDMFTCRICKLKTRNIHVHHLISFKYIIINYNIKNIKDALNCELLWNTNNGITVCKECHKKIHYGDKL